MFSNSHGASLKDHEKESSLKLKGIVASNPSLSFAENLSQRKIDSRGSSWSLVWSTRSSPSSQELFARVRNASSRWAVSVETLPLWGFGLSSWDCMAKGSRKSAQFSAEVRWFLLPTGVNQKRLAERRRHPVPSNRVGKRMWVSTRIHPLGVESQKPRYTPS